MINTSGVRIAWADLPEAVRAGVEAILGDSVVEAVSQRSGFSPGSADRVVLASGGRAFVKAVGRSINEDCFRMHRQEARITAALPPDLGAPTLLGSYDDGDWVAFALEDVEGRAPQTPWQSEELDAVLTTLRTLAAGTDPSPVRDLPEASTAFAREFIGWQELREDPWPGLDPWAAAHLDRLVSLADQGLVAAAGSCLVQCDVRADNLLVRTDGSVVLVDWPHARIGAWWLDTLMLLVNVELYGGQDVEALVAAHLGDVPADDITGFLAGLTGYFFNQGRKPSQPELPTVRDFQLAQGETTLAWLRRRLGSAR